MKVLIVERDASLLDTMRDVCHDEGHETTILTNCIEARAHLEKGHLPDLIVCDEFVPGNFGVQFRLELQKNSRWKEIPFILMRGQKPKDETSDLTKPFSLEDFVAVMNRIRPSSRTRT